MKTDRPHRNAAGFSLIEVLISIALLVVALLALNQLQGAAILNEYEAQQKSIAMLLADDMVSRINTNRGAASSYVTGSNGLTPVGYGDSEPVTCTGTGVSRDKCEWSNALKGTATTTDGVGAAGINQAMGCVIASATPNEYLVVVAWNGGSKASTQVNNCGQGYYTDDAYRRVVVRSFRIANLTGV